MVVLAVAILALTGAGFVAGGVAVLLGDAPLIGGVFLIIMGLAILAVAGGLMVARRMWVAAMEWKDLLAEGPGAVRLASIQPPQGAIFNREAVLTFEVEGKDGTVKSVERGITIPIPQAIIWKLSGHVPLPLAKLRERRELNLHLWGRRSA